MTAVVHVLDLASWKSDFSRFASRATTTPARPLKHVLSRQLSRWSLARVKAKFNNLRFAYFPRLKIRAKTSFYRYLIARRPRSQRDHDTAGALAASLSRRGILPRQHRRSLKDGAHPRSPATMAYVGPASGEVKEPGSRRRKFAGYLKAANELRQSYFQGGDAHPWGQEHDDDSQEHAFPDAAVARGGNEEMVFFPSYARVHNKQKVWER